MQVEERCGDSASQSARVPARSCRTQRGGEYSGPWGSPPLREPTSLYRGQLLPMALNNPPKHPQLPLDYGADAQNTLLTTLTLCSRDSQSDTAAPQRPSSVTSAAGKATKEKVVCWKLETACRTNTARTVVRPRTFVYHNVNINTHVPICLYKRAHPRPNPPSSLTLQPAHGYLRAVRKGEFPSVFSCTPPLMPLPTRRS
jgi:hypothetical protein